jgi:transposase
MRRLIFGPVPTDTSRAIQDILDLNQRYLRIGNHLNTILEKNDIDQVRYASEKPLNFTAILALVTVFQQLERYTDQQAADAIQSRADWKYALHLPLSYSGFDPAWLCGFRKYMLGEPAGIALVQAVVNHLVEINAYDLVPGHAPLADEILSSVCKLNRIVQIIETMLLAVEALANRESIQLPGVCLPELYERYTKTYNRLQQVETPEEMSLLACSIGVDIATLWNSMQLFEENGLQQWPEMENLWRIWRQQYDQIDCSPLCASSIIWQPVNCLRCQQEPQAELPP